MIYLLLSILSSITIVICFKIIDRIGLNAFNVIILNYLTAFILGLLLTKNERLSVQFLTNGEAVAAIIIGILFIIMFRILGLSIREAGMGTSTIAAKISVVLPILFSIIVYHETLPTSKVAGIIIAITALFLTLYHRDKPKKHAFLLPLLLFFGMGIVDSLVKYVQQRFLQEHNILVFSTFVFLISFLSGLLMKLAEKKQKKKSFPLSFYLTGILLGVANLGSLYFFIRALNADFLPSSLIFTLNNLGILIITVLAGIFFFRERFHAVNWVGFSLSLVSLYIIFEV